MNLVGTSVEVASVVDVVEEWEIGYVYQALGIDFVAYVAMIVGCRFVVKVGAEVVVDPKFVVAVVGHSWENMHSSVW